MVVHITQVPIPADVDAQPSWQAQGVTAVDIEVETEVNGNPDSAPTPRQVGVGLRDQSWARKVRLVATDTEPGAVTGPDEVLGHGYVRMPMLDNTSLAQVHLAVRSRHRGRGIGTALWHQLRDLAQADGRTVFQTYIAAGAEPDADDPDALSAPTGSGRVLRTAPGVRFALNRGFSFEQAERYSVLATPVDPALLERLRAEAAAVAGPAYELVAWTDRVPEHLIDAYALLQARMSTDAPQGDLALEEEAWDAGRIRTAEQTTLDFGLRLVAVGAVHRETNELVGYTAVNVDTARPWVGFQDNTIVLSQHRGHRLGMLLKAANAQRLAADHPQLRRIHTSNAEDNDHMLAINIALGYRPAGCDAAMQLTVAATR